MNVRVHNRTGLTIHTSAHASSPSRAMSDVPVEMPAEAWEHTLACAPGLRPLVGADGGIEVTEVGAAKAEPVEVAPVDVIAESVVAPVDAAPVAPLASGDFPIDETLAALTAASRPSLVPKGKRR